MIFGKNWAWFLALAIGLCAGTRNFLYVDEASLYSQLMDGVLTGPMLQSSEIGSIALVSGAVSQIWRRKLGLVLSIIGLALMLPLFSWFFAAGVWCLDGRCYGKYPLFSFHLFSAVTLVLACTSIALQWRPRPS